MTHSSTASTGSAHKAGSSSRRSSMRVMATRMRSTSSSGASSRRWRSTPLRDFRRDRVVFAQPSRRRERAQKGRGTMRHLPSVEALSDIDDRRLLAELEVYKMLEKLAKVRSLVDRANQVLATVITCGETSVTMKPQIGEACGMPPASLGNAKIISE